MTAATVAGGLLLVAATLALLEAGSRLAALAAPEPLARAVAAAVIAPALAVAEALGLGLVRLGGEPLALAGASVLIWALVVSRAPTPPRSLLEEGRLALARARPGARVAAGATAGVFAAWTIYGLVRPALGFDTVLYHLTEAVLWAQQGTPGSIEPVIVGLPVGNYPLTGEVLLGWAIALPESFAPVTLVLAGAWLLIGVGTWLGLSSVGAPRPAVALATAAIVATPPVAGWQDYGTPTDPIAFAFLLACAGLCAAAVRGPAGLLAPALVAGGLAIGVKTTVAPLAVAAIALALVARRRELRPVAGVLAVAAAAALVVGGPWYLRNLIDHGSPLWPFLGAAWGDPALELGTKFIEAPGNTIQALGGRWVDGFLGGLLLIGGGLLAPLIAPRRSVVAAAGATFVSFLLWTQGPFTGLAPDDPPLFLETSFSTTRYLLPAAFAGALGLALAARAPGLPGRVALAVLAGALCANLVQTFELETPGVPSPLVALVGGVAGGAGAAALLPLRGRPVRLRATGGGVRATGRYALAGLTVLAGGLALARVGDGYLERHLRTGDVFGGAVLGWLADRPGFADGATPIATARSTIALTAGDRIAHDLRPLEPTATCAAVREEAAAGPLVVYAGPAFELLAEPGATDPRDCLEGIPPLHDAGAFRVYGADDALR